MKTPNSSASGVGWWKVGDGPRQPITEVQLFFYDGRFSGSGIDEFGCFALHAVWGEGGKVSIRKHYGPLPGADLLGEYDGEGTFSGTWVSGDDSGTWAITMTGGLKPPDPHAHARAMQREERYIRLDRVGLLTRDVMLLTSPIDDTQTDEPGPE